MQEGGPSPFTALFKRGPPSSHESQIARRRIAIELQKQRRLEAVSRIRDGSAEENSKIGCLGLGSGLTSFQLDASSSASRPPITTKLENAPLKTHGKGSYSNRLMFAEEPTPLPVDIDQEWVALGPLPKGKRCLAVVNKPQHAGATPTMTLYSRKGGKPIAIWPSSRDQTSYMTEASPEVGEVEMQVEEQETAKDAMKNTRRSKKNLKERRIRFPAPLGLPPDTELDCILPSHYHSQEQGSSSSEHAGVLFVLDLLTWAGRSFEDFDTEFRMWWRDARLGELPTPVAPPGAVLEVVQSPAAECRAAGSKMMRVVKAPYPFLLVTVRATGAPLSMNPSFSRWLLESQGEDGKIPQLPRCRGATQIPAIRADAAFTPGPDATDAMEVDHSRDADAHESDVLRRRQELVHVQVPISEVSKGGDNSSSAPTPTVKDDGILLYHRSACYEAGMTPLALWLSPPGWRPLPTTDEGRPMSEEDGI